MSDRAWSDVRDLFDAWDAQLPDADPQTYALRMMEDALGEYETQITVLRQALAASAHDYAVLRARLAQERTSRVRWYETAVAPALNVWDALVGEERHNLTGFLACLFCVAVFVASLLVGPVC